MTSGVERQLSLLARFERYSLSAPDAPAVSVGSQTLTYRELSALVQTRAAGLRKKGVSPGDVVGMCLLRGIEPIATFLSIWSVSAAWVFLDSDYPAARLQTIVDDSDLRWVVVDGCGPDLVGATTLHLAEIDADGLRPDIPAVPSANSGDTDLAYLIYTSGSTGKPKGVAVEHQHLKFFVDAFDETVLRSPKEAVWIAGAALSFDMCIPESVGALSCGGHVVVRRRLEALAPLVDRFGGTHLQCTPTQLSLFLSDPDDRAALSRLQHVIVAGEPLTAALAKDFRRSFAGRFTNAYGPTEITVYASWLDVGDAPSGQISVGKSLPGITCATIDPESCEVLAAGARGELVIGGPGVSRGYYKQPELTDRSFIEIAIGPNGAPMRAYRSGDLAEIHLDGTISTFGRLDHQVKVRGHRIELGDIEAVLAHHDAIRLVAVLLESGETGQDERLVAHVTCHSGMSVDSATLRSYCRSHLPEFMVPAAVVVHNDLPYTSSGKINRSALLDSGIPADSERLTLEWGTNLRADSRLGRMISVWEEVLRVPVECDDNFFAVGGHSLLGVELLIRVNETFGRRFPLGSLITAGTPRLLLEAIDTDASPNRCLQPLRVGTGPATIIIHGGGGYLLRLYTLAQDLTPGSPVYGFQAFGLQVGEVPDNRVEDMAKRYLGELAVEGLFDEAVGVLVGYSGGGIIAAEMASQISETGRVPPVVIALDTDLPPSSSVVRSTYWKNLIVNISTGGLPVIHAWWRIRKSRSIETLRRDRLRSEVSGYGFADIQGHIESLLAAYRPREIFAPFGLVRVSEESPSERPDFGWKRFAMGAFAERTTTGNHFSILEEPLLGELLKTIDLLLAELAEVT